MARKTSRSIPGTVVLGLLIAITVALALVGTLEERGVSVGSVTPPPTQPVQNVSSGEQVITSSNTSTTNTPVTTTESG